MKLLTRINVAALSVLILIATIFVVRTMPALPPQAPPTVIVETLDESLQPFSNFWRTEVARRFPDAVVVACHGGEFIEGEWLVKSPEFGKAAITADKLAQHFKDKYPGRVIVMLACNPGHLHLHVSGVYHAMDSVWCLPDRATMSDQVHNRLMLDGGFGEREDRWVGDPNVVGSIFEFLQD